MNIKLLGLVVVLAGSVKAEGAGAFATGFANALNRRLGGQDYQAPSYNQNTTQNAVVPRVDEHYDAVNTYGTFGGYYFFNRQECENFVRRSGGAYSDCSLVESR